MHQVVAESFDKIDGACDYFHLLERDNDARTERHNQLPSSENNQNKHLKSSDQGTENKRDT